MRSAAAAPNRSHRRLPAFAAILVLLAVPPALADDTPPGCEATMLQEHPCAVWQGAAPLPSSSSSPRLLLASSEGVYRLLSVPTGSQLDAMVAADGKAVWSVALAGSPVSLTWLPDESLLLATTSQGVTAIHPMTGGTAWARPTLARVLSVSPDSGTVLAAHYPTGLEAVDAATGVTRWTVTTDDAGRVVRGFTGEGDALARRMFAVVITAEAGFEAIGMDTRTGRVLWTASLPGPSVAMYLHADAGTGRLFATRLANAPDGVAVTVAELAPPNGNLLSLRTHVGGSIGKGFQLTARPLLVASDTLVLAGSVPLDGSGSTRMAAIAAFRLEGGAVAWRAPLPGARLTTPAAVSAVTVADGTLWAVGAAWGRVPLTSGAYLWGLDAASGATVGYAATIAPAGHSATATAVAMADGKAFVTQQHSAPTAPQGVVSMAFRVPPAPILDRLAPLP